MQFLTLLMAAASLAKAIPHARPLPVTIEPYNPATDPETVARQENAKRVECKIYIGQLWNNAGVAPCNSFCGNLPPASGSSGVNVSSVSCLSTGGVGTALPTGTDSIGEYNIGVCECNLGLVVELVGDIVAALPAIAEVGCEIFMDAFESVFKLGMKVIPVGNALQAADAGTQALVKGAQAIKKAAGKSSDFFDWINKAACGTSKATSEVDKVFDDITLGQGAGSGGTGNLASDAAPLSTASAPSSPSTSSTAVPASTTSSTTAPTSTTAPSSTTSAPITSSPTTTSTGPPAPTDSASQGLQNIMSFFGGLVPGASIMMSPSSTSTSTSTAPPTPTDSISQGLQNVSALFGGLVPGASITSSPTPTSAATPTSTDSNMQAMQSAMSQYAIVPGIGVVDKRTVAFTA